MPASAAALIDAALFSAFSQKSSDELDENSARIKNNYFPTCKQVSLDKVEVTEIYKKATISANSGTSFPAIKKKYGNLKGERAGPTKKNSTMARANEDKLEEPRTVLWPADKVVLGWRKVFPRGAGMSNLGNTCYMNSSLQALFHIPSLANWLLEECNSHISACETNVHNQSFCSICGMMKTLKQALGNNDFIKPFHIHNKLKSIGKTLYYGRQEDAHEFIKLLIDHMEKSFLSQMRANKLDHRSKETTPLNQIFGGYLRQQVSCPRCRYVSTTFSHFQDIALDIRSVGSVDNALDLYFRKETLDSDNAYKCEKCHNRVPATKRHLIEKAPHVLLIQLKRFTMTGGKINKHVNIQKNIDISKYVNAPGTYNYRLVSMVIHLGNSQHGGHYIAVAEASNKTMVEFDDADVRSITVDKALSMNPYILFYEMCHPGPYKNYSGMNKQVMRQSSEKLLLRQNSTDRMSNKPLPTSLSTSCMSNGIGSSSSEVGEAVKRNSYHHKSKSPLIHHKERERVSFGIKSNNIDSHSNHNSSKPCLNSTGQSNSSANVDNNKRLVPYNTDSEDSEEDKELRKTGLMNGHHSSVKENGHSRPMENGKGTSKNGSLEHGKSGHKNGCQENGAMKIRKSYNNEDRVSTSYTNGKQSTSLLPRTLQVNMSKNNIIKSNGVNRHQNKSLNGSSSDCSDNNSPKGASDRSTNSLPSKSKKPELEKSLSQDSVLPINSRTIDRVETASLKSKDSVDSNKSDKSSRSMKKSFLSLLPCVPSNNHSPDLSPEHARNLQSSSNNSLTKNELNSLEDSLESQFSKRNRDHDDPEPRSPSKKCRPEDRLHENESKSGKSNSKKDNFKQEPKNSSPNWDDSIETDSKSSKNCLNQEDENFSMEEKKSRHKRKRKREDNSSSEDEAPPAKKHSPIIVQWDEKFKKKPGTTPSLEIPSNVGQSNGEPTVADKLKQSSNFSFGVPVSSWDGEPSSLDIETEKYIKESRKRTEEDYYNDELDSGKLPKKKFKHRDHDYSESTENKFQTVQDNPHLISNNFNKPWNNKFNGNNRHNNNFINKNFYRGHAKSWNNSSRLHFKPTQNHYRSNSYGGGKSWHNNRFRNGDKFRH